MTAPTGHPSRILAALTCATLTGRGGVVTLGHRHGVASPGGGFALPWGGGTLFVYLDGSSHYREDVRLSENALRQLGRMFDQ